MEKRNLEMKGHLAVLFTIVVWGTTFISTKFLLEKFTPMEILFFRFLLGTIVLFLIKPELLKVKNKKEHKYFIIAGISGVSLYFLFENIALTMTEASNIGIIVSISPFFTAIISQFFLPKERLKLQFFIGFIFAILGIVIITTYGEKDFSINPLGDILGILAAFIWSIYSIAMKKLGNLRYNTIKVTRRVFLIGIIFMLPFLFILDFKFNLKRFDSPFYIINIIYLGIGASAICFVTWNWSVKILGAIRTSVYVYLIPVITLIASSILLKETITIYKIIGIILILIGLFISENTFIERFKKKLIINRS